MKTKFFKKLSLVLVLAMVLSVFVPVAGAFAAKAPKLNSTNKYLHLGRVDKGQNKFNFVINNKEKGYSTTGSHPTKELQQLTRKMA